MLLVAVTIIGAVGYGWLRGGRVVNLGRVTLRRWWLLAAAVAFQALLAGLTAAGSGTAAAPVLLALSQLSLLGFIWMNRLVPGMTLVLLGLALNAAVILANGGMPVDLGALRALSADGVPAEPFVAGKHRVLAAGARLPWLADIIALPVLRSVVSVGDVALAAGAAVLVAGLMQPPAGRRLSSRGVESRGVEGPGRSAAEPADRLGETLG